MKLRDLRWPFEETWRTYDHVTFWIYTVGCMCLGGLLHWSWP
jgi:hypothetical protein